jgi:hypothetical protein
VIEPEHSAMVRVGHSRDPDERLRLTRVNCMANPEILHGFWTEPKSNGALVVGVVLRQLGEQGLIVTGKVDWVLMKADAVAELIWHIGEKLKVQLLSVEQREALLDRETHRLLDAAVPQKMPVGLRRGRRG